MAFDPSIISQIPDMAGNPAQAKQNAYKLADLVDETQLRKLQLRGAEQEQKDAATAKGILSKADISTPEGMMKAAQELNRSGLARQSMDLMKEAGQQKKQGLEMTEDNLKILQLASDVVGPAAMQVKQALHTQGLPMAQAAYQQALARLPPEVQGKFPPQLPNNPQQADQLLDQAINNSQHARQILAQQTQQKNVDSEIQHRKVEERQGQERIDIAKKNANSFSGDTSDLMAALAERGVSLPTGFRSKQQQIALYQGLLARNPGKSADQIAEGIAKGQIEFGAQKKETQTAAGVAGKVEVAQNEIEQFVPLVREASIKVPRTKFVPINKLLQAGEASISDPDLKELRIYVNSVLNAYDMLAARGGTDKDKRAQAHSLITSADSPEALERGLKAFEKEAGAAHRAAVQATKVPELSDSSGAGPVKPYADADKEARYQEWKKKHGG